MKRPEATKGQRMTLQAIYAYLAKKGIPRWQIDAIREALIYDAVTEGHNIQMDRIYTGIAIMLRKEYGFGVERILRGLRRFDDVCGSVLDKNMDGEDIADWTNLMEWLKADTGIVIQTGDDNRLICEVSRD